MTSTLPPTALPGVDGRRGAVGEARDVGAVTRVVADAAGRQLRSDLDDAHRHILSRVIVGQALSSPWLPVDLAEQHSTVASADFRRLVAANRSTPPHVLAELSHDADFGVSSAARANPHVPYSCVQDSLGGPRHPDCPPDTVLQSLESDAWRAGLASSHLPDLARRSNPRAAWAPHLDLSGTVLDTEVWALALHRCGDADIETLLANEALRHDEALVLINLFEVDKVRRRAKSVWAQNPGVDPRWLGANLSRDRSALRGVAGNPTADPRTLQQLVVRHVDERELVERVATNPASDFNVLSQLWADCFSSYSRFTFAAAHCRTPGQAQAVLALAPTWKTTLSELLDVGADLSEPAA